MYFEDSKKDHPKATINLAAMECFVKMFGKSITVFDGKRVR